MAASTQVAAIGDQSSFQAELDAYMPNLRAALPAHVSVDKFARVLTTAVSGNPDLYYANRRTLFNSAVRCASDGLLPDGREAALVVFNTRVKQKDPETGLSREISIEAVQYMPMVAGIRKRMRNSGDVLSAIAEVVYANDTFKYSKGDDGYIQHDPTPLGEDAGEPIGAYAIIKLKSGEVIRDVMSRKDIETTRAQSRAKNSLMWTTFWSEGARKTVLHRCAKAAPQTSEYEAMFDHGGGVPVHEAENLALAAPPEPQRPLPPMMSLQQPVDDRPEYAVYDNDGIEHIFRSVDATVQAVAEVVREAAATGLDRLLGIWESNTGVVETLQLQGFESEALSLAVEYETLKRELTPPPPVAPAAAPPPPSSPTQTPTAASPAPPPPERGAPEPATAPEAPPAATVAPAPAQASQAPAHAATPPPADDTFPGDLPSRDDRVSLAIPPGMKAGKPDYRGWAVGQFMPRLRQQRDPAVLPYFLGDNEANLTEARAALSVADLRELEQAIADQWKLVG